MDYIVAGFSITNDIVFADGTTSKGHLGGSIFALEGVRIWSDNCLYISNVGPDFPDYYGKWMSDNCLPLDGIAYKLPHTHYDVVQYYPDNQYYEYSIYGDSYFKDYMELTRVTPQQILAALKDTKGIYLDINLDNPNWKQGIPQIQATGCKVMWELPPQAKDPAFHGRIMEMIELVDIYSLNLPESKAFFCVDSEEEAIEKILEIGKPCFYRVGSKGSYMIMDGKVAFAPSIDIGEPIDPTGCGNCSTASALYCWCEGYDPLMICVMSNIAAAYNILQYGPYPKFTQETTARALALAKEYYDKFNK